MYVVNLTIMFNQKKTERWRGVLLQIFTKGSVLLYTDIFALYALLHWLFIIHIILHKVLSFDHES